MAVLPGMGWILWGRSTKERIEKDWHHLKGQIRQRLPSLLQFFPKAKFGIRFRSIRDMRPLCSRAAMMLSASSTRGVERLMAIGKADQIASLALTGNRQPSLARPQEHASHSFDESKSNTCRRNLLLELTRQTRGAGDDGGWIVLNSTACTQRSRTGRPQMHVKHNEKPQATRHDLSNLPKATTKSNYQLRQHSTREK